MNYYEGIDQLFTYINLFRRFFKLLRTNVSVNKKMKKKFGEVKKYIYIYIHMENFVPNFKETMFLFTNVKELINLLELYVFTLSASMK